MVWTTTTWIVAALFPVLTVAGLLISWRRGSKFALATLGFSLCAAEVHAAVERVAILPMEWGVLAIAALLCAACRFRTGTVAWLALVGLTAGGLAGWGAWQESQRQRRNGPGCPLMEEVAWYYSTPASQLTAVFVAPSDGPPPAVPEQIPIGGLAVTKVGNALAAPSRTALAAAEERLVIPEDAISLLDRTHRDVSETFISGSGFGYRRMGNLVAWPDLQLPLACDPASDEEPGERAATETAAVSATPTSPESNPSRNGADTEDRRPKSRWVAERLQLVGLLKSRTPRAYEIQGAPPMVQLGSAPTRPLDEFEQSALARLQAGENLVVSGRAGEIRVLGALRAESRCAQCHEVKPDALLGAFTYRFLPARQDQPVDVPGNPRP